MKKMICVLLTMVILFPVGVYAREKKPLKVQLNGNYINFDVQPVVVDGSLMVPMKTLAEKVNVNVTYDGAKRQVTAVKADTSAILTIDSKTAQISDKKGVQTVNMSTAPIILNGRTMVPLRFFVKTFSIDIGWDRYENTAVLIDYSYFVKRIKDSNSNLYKAVNLIKANQNYHNTVTENFDSITESKTFGVTLKAGSLITTDLKQDGKKVSANISILNSGLFNLYTFITQTMQSSQRDGNDSFVAPDFDKPMDIKYMTDGNAIYVKSDFILGMILNGYQYSYLSSDYKKALKSKWIKFTMDDNEGKNLLTYNDLDADQRMDLILRGLFGMFDTFENDYMRINSTDYFAKTDNVVTLLSGLFGDDQLVLTDKADGTTHITYTLNEKAIYDVIIEIANSVEDEDVKSEMKTNINQIFEFLHLNISADVNVKDGIALNSVTQITCKMDNIPNPYNMKIATIDSKFSVKSSCDDVGKVSINKNEIPFGDNVIDKEQIDKDAEQAETDYFKNWRSKYYKDYNIDYDDDTDAGE